MSMDFATPRRKPARESVVPMINVVFLLLIFFLMTAQIAPPDPVEITPPVVLRAETALSDTLRIVWLDRDGVLHLQAAADENVLARLAADPGPVALRADADLPAAEFARVLRQMSEAGITDVTLVAVAGTE